MNDLRLALRSLRKSPGFTTVAILTLGLGIGANTAIFSVVNGVLLNPLPYPKPDRIAYLGWQWERGGYAGALSALKFEFWREHSRVFEGVTTARTFSADLGGAGSGVVVRGSRIRGDFLTVLGTRLARGRGFTPEELMPGGPQVAIVDDGVWREQLGATPDINGRTIRLGDDVYAVVGVLPPDFRFAEAPDNTQVLIPLRFSDAMLQDGGHNYTVIARLRPGITRERAQADMARVFAAFRAAYPQGLDDDLGVRLLDYRTVFVGEVGDVLWILLGAIGLVLLIACANVANLLLARAVTRESEMAVRAALGAGRRRILRQLLIEGLVLALVAGAAGLMLSRFGIDALLALAPYALLKSATITVDGYVLGFTLGLATMTGIFFGLAAALPPLRMQLVPSLKQRGRGGGAGRRPVRARDALVAAEAGLAIVLLSGAGLLVASFVALRMQDPAFDARELLTVRFPRAPEALQTPDAVHRFEQQALERLRGLPGVTAAAGANTVPLERGWNIPVTVEGRPDATLGATEWRAITPGYFHTLRTRVARGREFTPADAPGAPHVAMINEAMAQRFWPGEDAIGQRLLVGHYRGEAIMPGFEVPREVVGIAADVRDRALGRLPVPTVYVPYEQAEASLAGGLPLLLVRAPRAPQLAPAIRQALQQVDPRLPAPEFRTMEQVLGASLALERFNTLLMSIFAGIALLLSAVGIYAVVAYSAGRRTREIGLRMALGARSDQVLAVIVTQGMYPVLCGLAVGVLAALGLTRFIAGMLYGVGPRDPLTLAGVAVVLAGVALLASWLPARRAARVAPMEALRYE